MRSMMSTSCSDYHQMKFIFLYNCKWKLFYTLVPPEIWTRRFRYRKLSKILNLNYFTHLGDVGLTDIRFMTRGGPDGVLLSGTGILVLSVRYHGQYHRVFCSRRESLWKRYLMDAILRMMRVIRASGAKLWLQRYSRCVCGVWGSCQFVESVSVRRRTLTVASCSPSVKLLSCTVLGSWWTDRSCAIYQLSKTAPTSLRTRFINWEKSCSIPWFARYKYSIRARHAMK